MLSFLAHRSHDSVLLFRRFFLYFFVFFYCFFFFNDPATTEIYTLSLHDALPISPNSWLSMYASVASTTPSPFRSRSEEHTSELQSRQYLVCRLLLEKKKNTKTQETRVHRPQTTSYPHFTPVQLPKKLPPIITEIK